MASISDVARTTADSALTDFLQVAHNADGTQKSGGGGSISVTDGTTTVSAVTEISVSGGTVADGGGGIADVTVVGGVSSVFGRTGVVTGVFSDYDAHGFTVNQVGHGFTVGAIACVRFNGSTWVAAKADVAADADVDGIAVATDANNFNLYLNGSRISGLTGLTAGTDYFLDPSTAGAITITEPSTAGQVSVPIGKAVSTTQLVLHALRGLVIPTAAVLVVPVKLVDDSTSITTGEGKFSYVIRADLNGKKLVVPSGTTPGIGAAVSVAPTGTGLSFGIRKNAATEMLSTNITVDTTKLTSDQSAAAPVVNAGNATVATGDVIWIDCDQADSNAVSRGSLVFLAFQ